MQSVTVHIRDLFLVSMRQSWKLAYFYVYLQIFLKYGSKSACLYVKTYAELLFLPTASISIMVSTVKYQFVLPIRRDTLVHHIYLLFRSYLIYCTNTAFFLRSICFSNCSWGTCQKVVFDARSEITRQQFNTCRISRGEFKFPKPFTCFDAV